MLQKNDQITSIAETLAICQALDDLVESNVNLLVLSDSLSVLSALQNFSIKSNKYNSILHLNTESTYQMDTNEIIYVCHECNKSFSLRVTFACS
ncbi:hypothetical protein TNCV_4707201 [Trichonephila clavipes]|nr:hypothetical protein TNCV_4707201 [Trichonephila clavipes]